MEKSSCLSAVIILCSQVHLIINMLSEFFANIIFFKVLNGRTYYNAYKTTLKKYTRPQLKNRCTFHTYKFIESRLVRDLPFYIEENSGQRGQLSCQVGIGVGGNPYVFLPSARCLEPYTAVVPNLFGTRDQFRGR